MRCVFLFLFLQTIQNNKYIKWYHFMHHFSELFRPSSPRTCFGMFFSSVYDFILLHIIIIILPVRTWR